MDIQSLRLKAFLLLIFTTAFAHDYAPCQDDEHMLSNYPTLRQWKSSTFNLPPNIHSCSDIVPAGGCNWRDDRSVYLYPWRQACPRSCNLCATASSEFWHTLPQTNTETSSSAAATTATSTTATTVTTATATTAATATLHDLGTKCDIDRVTVSNVEEQRQVHRDYVSKGIPVIVKGLVHPSNWTLATWVDRATKQDTVLSSSAEEDLPVVQFLQQEYHRVQHLGYNQYGDLNEYPDHSIEIRQQLEQSYHPHVTIMTGRTVGTLGDDDNRSGDMLRSTCGHLTPEWSHHWILVAGQGTSTAWHVDQFNSSAWNTVLHGSKRWSLAPPSLRPPGMKDPFEFDEILIDQDEIKHYDYFEDLANGPWGVEMPWTMASSRYSKIHDEYVAGLSHNAMNKQTSPPPLECMLNKNETIFVPSGWWHTVYNVRTSIAITENVVTASNFMNVLAELMARPKSSNPWQCAKLLIDKFPELVTSDWLVRFGKKWRKLPLSFRTRIKKRMKKKKMSSVEKKKEL